jgi:hypothetical protein
MFLGEHLGLAVYAEAGRQQAGRTGFQQAGRQDDTLNLLMFSRNCMTARNAAAKQ